MALFILGREMCSRLGDSEGSVDRRAGRTKRVLRCSLERGECVLERGYNWKAQTPTGKKKLDESKVRRSLYVVVSSDTVIKGSNT